MNRDVRCTTEYGIHSLGTGEDRVAVRTELPTDPLSTNISWQSIVTDLEYVPAVMPKTLAVLGHT